MHRIEQVFVKAKEISGILTLVALAVLLIVFTNTSEYFLSVDNMLAILLTASTVSYIAVGQFMVLVSGYFDLSVGNVAAMGGVLMAILINAGVNVLAAILIALSFGLFSGFVASVAIAVFNCNAFVSTFALMQIYRGILFVMTGGMTISVPPNDAFRFLGTYKLFGIVQMPIVIMIVLFVFFNLLLKFTRLGRAIYCVGNNAEAAKISGINVVRAKMFAYMMTGFFAALTGVVFASRINSGQPMLGATYALDTVAACVIGGTSMSGGKGNLWGAFIGIIIVYVIQNGLIMTGMDASYHYIATGLIMFFAVFAQTEKAKR